MCRVAVGRAYVCREEEVEGLGLPEGYDSFYLKRGESVFLYVCFPESGCLCVKRD